MTRTRWCSPRLQKRGKKVPPFRHTKDDTSSGSKGCFQRGNKKGKLGWQKKYRLLGAQRIAGALPKRGVLLTHEGARQKNDRERKQIPPFGRTKGGRKHYAPKKGWQKIAMTAILFSNNFVNSLSRVLLLDYSLL